MKKSTLLILLLFVSSVFYAQSNGITYQAIIYNPNGDVIPGYNNANSPLANKSVCLQFSIVDGTSQTEYQEKISTITDEFGMVNLVIGSGVQTGGYATSFSNIYWSYNQKSLKVALDIVGRCDNFVEISNQNFESIPFAFAANSAENVTGVVPIENGGTNAITVLGAKTNLGLQSVDNTRDLDKPVSTATQAALNGKEDLVNKSNNMTIDGTSITKYPTVKSVKDYVDARQSVPGPQGIAGPVGPQGPQGDKGDIGIQGDKGDTGLQGIQGDIGLQGDKGDTGLQGLQGDKGDIGLQGDKGDTGLQGDKGDTGLQGDKGDTGLQGDKGDTGLQGIQGCLLYTSPSPRDS